MSQGPGEPTRFEVQPVDLKDGVWTMGVSSHGFLLGNAVGLFFQDRAGNIEHLIEGDTVSHAIMLDDERCLVIGERTLSVLRWDGQSWRRAVPDVPAIGFPSALVRLPRDVVWIEQGIDRVGRIAVTNSGPVYADPEVFAWLFRQTLECL